MSLLLIAIVQDNDADRVVDALNKAGHRSTRLASVGGFLGARNTTLITAIEEAAEQDVVAIFERECSSREMEVPLVMLDRLKDAFPKVVNHGGATIFTTELRSIVRL